METECSKNDVRAVRYGIPEFGNERRDGIVFFAELRGK